MALSRHLLVAPLAGVLIRRAVAYWVLLHLMRILITVMAAASARVPVAPADLLPGGNPLIVALTVVLGMVEARRRDEDLFLANLGYGWSTTALYLVLPALGLEAAFTAAHVGWGTLAAYAALPLAGLDVVFRS
ncbi:hypothetical protein [Longimicrobium terrae]|uniref:Uncharacterized protein n=1 Tax=Longimicrobium terrae TaxID=1639882 RepID=A0A841H677_9BACT|nr:hypothetical protein [Longimicrobium terrae]MBB4639238.1 hypothetical protein [Longimicrobium terrae]MBB6073478.1 hypothetical protein [Longimicrobium terrae]NNC32272.1 hypothetical protein [Longimicrobium terrae]